jgi:hypothetical protein
MGMNDANELDETGVRIAVGLIAGMVGLIAGAAAAVAYKERESRTAWQELARATANISGMSRSPMPSEPLATARDWRVLFDGEISAIRTLYLASPELRRAFQEIDAAPPRLDPLATERAK